MSNTSTDISGRISANLSLNIMYLEDALHLKNASDILIRNFNIGENKAYWIGINGLVSNDTLQYIFSDILDKTNTFAGTIVNIEDFMNSRITYGQAELCSDWNKILRHILSGPSVMFIDGFDQAIVLDCRHYPGRSISEPDVEIVTKGAKDSFTESLTSNTGLIRRRIRSRNLIFHRMSIGLESKTDVSIGYICDKCDLTLVSSIQEKLSLANITSITMGSKSIEEILVHKRWYNPMPLMISTQRPDVVASYLSEGYVCIVTDTSPYVIILPTTIFQYTQSPEDYYKNPAMAGYIRFIRFISIITALLLMPIFLLLGSNKDTLPQWLYQFTGSEMSNIRALIYVVFVELGLDLFKYASAHSFSGYSNSLSIVGGLIIGDIATSLNWASTEILFYEAITLLATLALPYVEFGDAIRMYRLFLVLTTGIGCCLGFGVAGFTIGTILVFLSIITTPTFGNKSYLWPLYPFNWSALKTLFFRYTTPSVQPIKTWKNL